ncbi:MAG: cytochrome b/b6 domain-containing protein [Alphaproteobacteria bacterium]|nr:cytochrome b/b6 domain-containing protein [Alphaproteobacteria bacterium]
MQIKVWDGATRLFHWALVIAFIFSVYSAFQDKYGIYAEIHTYAGVSVLALVAWRILWGIVGSDTSRFSHFVKGPNAIRAYLRGEGWDGVGHNPLGALSVVLMLVLLLAQAGMGLFASDGMFFDGPFARDAGSWSGDLTRWHRWTGYSLMGLAGLHVLAVLWYAGLKKIQMILPIITGSKQFSKAVAAPRLRSPILALGLALGVAFAAWYFILA